MPITQSRMIRLIRTADLFKDHILSAQHFVTEICRELPPAPTHEELLTAIQTIQLYFAQLSFPPAEIDNLSAERAHFAANATKNNRQTLRAQNKRPARQHNSTAPETMQKPLNAAQAIARELPPPKPSPILAVARIATIVEEQKTLSQHKLDYNAIAQRFKMPKPYADPYDDTTPLLPEHGGPAPDGDEDSVF